MGVDEVLAAAARAGGRITRATQRTDWGRYSGYFEALDGHLREIAHNPGLGLLPDGRIVLAQDLIVGLRPRGPAVP